MQDVQRLFGWMAGLVSIAALARVLARRRRRETHAAEPQAVAQDPAEELRRKLSESREAAGATEPTDPPEPTETLEERRSRVHAKAQEAIEAMQDAPE
jgi:flagellar biosynthesis/type III secretory pathway M-ring protein FliF/YscJ